MNLEDLKLTGTNNITISDSLKAPLLKLSVKNTGEAPESNDLIVTIASSPTDEAPRNYSFSLTSPLALNEIFSFEPTIKGDKVTMVAKVERTDGTIEECVYESVILNQGENYITTNYANATIEIFYPKNIELVKLFLNNAIYSLNTENKILSLDDIYFKDCFTQVEDKINAQFNRLTVKCFNSESGNFSMDCDGNLVVNSVTAREGTSIPSGGVSIDTIYPVGSIYLSVNNVNPSELFGGTWVAFASGRTLVGVDSAISEFNAVEKTGGSMSHTHTSAAHTHSINGHTHTSAAHSHGLSNGYALINPSATTNGIFSQVKTGVSSWTDNYRHGVSDRKTNSSSNTRATALGGNTNSTTPGETGSTSLTTNSTTPSATGSTSSLAPFITCYMWKRTA